MNLKGNDFLKLLDCTPEQIDYLLQLAAKLKAEKKSGVPHRLCADLRQQQQCGKAAQHRQKRQTVSYFHAIT